MFLINDLKINNISKDKNREEKVSVIDFINKIL